MRRPRHKLQVSTFPFLAVLLCAMGSLILLLLVMDRRAKIVTRNKAREAYLARKAKTQTETEEERQTRRAEWQRQREKLHAFLEEQGRELQEQMRAVKSELGATRQDLEKRESDSKALQKRLAEEQTKLDLKHQLLLQMRAGLAQTDQRAGASQEELAKLERALGELERALGDLRLLRQRDQQTYSLVPYRGKLGEGRRPIYVECTADGIMFHPERRLLENPDFDIQTVRNEIQRRGAKLVREKHDHPDRSNRPQPPQTSTNPYVLFLVRPDGIDNYYRVQSALRGFDLDFGYEFVDAGWVLDFGGGDKTAGTVTPAVPGPEVLPQRPGTKPGFDPGPRPNQIGGNGQGPAGLSTAQGDGIGPQVPETGLRFGPLVGFGPGGTGVGLPGSGSGFGPPTQGIGPGLGSGPGVDSPGGIGTGLPNPALVAGLGAAPQGTQTFSETGSGLGGVSGSETPGTMRARAGTSEVQRTPGVQGNPRQPGSVGSNNAPPGGPPGNGSPASPQELPWGGSNGAAPAPKDNPQTPGATGSRVGEGPSGPPGDGPRFGNPGGTDPGPETDPIARLGSTGIFNNPKPGPAKTPPPSLGRLLSNRDYLLTIECFDDVAALYPGGQVFAMKSGADQKNIDQVLVQTALQLIARRQATVRPGEPPYRPLLRFQVHPEGLRTYYRVYPLFENLRLPMTRENLDS